MILLVQWSLVALALYGAVHVEPRLVGPFILLLLLYVLIALGGNRVTRTGRFVAVSLTGYLCIAAAHDVRLLASRVTQTSDPPYLQAAMELRRSGIGPGARLAVIGDPFDAGYAAYAAQDLLVAQVPSLQRFLELSATEAEDLKARLQRVGVAAIVTSHAESSLPGADWCFLTLGDSSRFGILLIGR
jgi:hypothetical protein